MPGNSLNLANAIVKGLTGSFVNEKDIDNGDIKPSTSTALLKIQRELNILDSTGKKLTEDGIMGEKTWMLIRPSWKTLIFFKKKRSFQVSRAKSRFFIFYEYFLA